MIVSQELARVAWPGQSAIGKRMACCEGGPNEPDWKIVVGVAGDVRSSGLAQAAGPEFYLPVDQVPAVAWDWIQRTMYIVARSAGNPSALAPSLRTIVNAIDPNVPIFDVRSMEERLITSNAPARFNTWMLAALGAVGLVLAAIGIYGVIAYFVGQRSQEIGVRMALGASARDVVTLVVRQAIGPVLIGVLRGSRCLARAPRCDERTVLRRVAARPGHARHRDGRARHRVVAGEHHPGPARGARLILRGR